MIHFFSVTEPNLLNSIHFRCKKTVINPKKIRDIIHYIHYSLSVNFAFLNSEFRQRFLLSSIVKVNTGPLCTSIHVFVDMFCKPLFNVDLMVCSSFLYCVIFTFVS